MNQSQNDKIQIDLFDTTSIFNKQINNNLFFDGYTLVYLSGSHIISVINILFSIMFFKIIKYF